MRTDRVNECVVPTLKINNETFLHVHAHIVAVIRGGR